MCGDFAFYQFPSPEFWKSLFEDSPESLSLAFKVPEDLTVFRWPTHARYGTRGGTQNDHFLRADLFTKLFAKRLLPYRERVAPLIFEFGTFPKAVFTTPHEFYARLDPFLDALPTGFRYAVELRNPEYLSPTYFSLLASHNVAHVFNAWTRMPELQDQLALEGAFTADFTVARALLTRHQNYDSAVNAFEPYDRTQEVNQGVRDALYELATTAVTRRRPAFLFVNNRLEGHAPSTIEAVAQAVEAALP